MQSNKNILFEIESLKVQKLKRSMEVVFDIALVYKNVVFGTL